MDIALLHQYIDKMLSIIPVRIKEEGEYAPKSPKLISWKKYESELPTHKDVDKWFGNADDNTGVALICGKISENTEVLDIDNHLNNADELFDNVIELIQNQYPEMLDNITIQKTQSGGYHLIYRCEADVSGNQKLAKQKKNDKIKTVIETRGEGGYALIHPSPLYSLISLTNQRNSIANIRKISEKQRNFLHYICKAFDETGMHEPKENKNNSNRRLDEGLRAGDDFNIRSSIDEIINPHGWKMTKQTGRVQHWTRPGKDKGLSATFNHIPDTFWVFSTNAHPLEEGRKYDKFGLWTALNVGTPDDTDNLKTAALELGKKGFGSVKIQNDSGNAITVMEPKSSNKNGTSSNDNGVATNKKTLVSTKRMNVAEKNEFIEEWLNERYNFRYNIVKGYVEFSPIDKDDYIQLTDKHTNEFWRDLMKENVTTTRTYLDNLIDSGFSKDYHPFKTFFKNLPEWDGNDHIEQFISLIKVEKQYENLWNKYFTRWIIGVIATALERGLNHNCIVLKGGQGIGKTTIINKLIPKELQEYYATTQITPQDKDSKLLLTDSFMINLDELESSTRNEVGHLKSLMTLEQVTARRPYGRRAEILKRRASFIASVNRTSFLSDLTGSRRFLVVEVKDIDFQKEFDVYQLYAQALHHFKNGMQFWFTKEEIPEINEANKQFEILRPEEELIVEYFEPYDFDDEISGKDLITQSNANPTIKLMTATDILNTLSKKSSAQLNSRILGQILSNLNFKQKLIKENGIVKRVYALKSVNDEQSPF